MRRGKRRCLKALQQSTSKSSILPWLLKQTMPCESTLQLVAVATHHTFRACYLYSCNAAPFPPFWPWLKLVFCRIVWRRGSGASWTTAIYTGQCWCVINAMCWYGTCW